MKFKDLFWKDKSDSKEVYVYDSSFIDAYLKDKDSFINLLKNDNSKSFISIFNEHYRFDDLISDKAHFLEIILSNYPYLTELFNNKSFISYLKCSLDHTKITNSNILKTFIDLLFKSRSVNYYELENLLRPLLIDKNITSELISLYQEDINADINLLYLLFYITKDIRILERKDFELEGFLRVFSNLSDFLNFFQYGNFSLNNDLITQKFIKTLFNKYGIVITRNFITQFAYLYPEYTFKLNDYLDKCTYEEIKSIPKETGKLSFVSEMISKGKKITDSDLYKIQKLANNNFYYLDAFEESENISNLLHFLDEINNVAIGNLVIDYLFHENYYNIMLDLQELLEFNKEYHFLEQSHLDIYNLILNINSISFDKLMELLEGLKEKHLDEMFYDDMMIARNTLANNIKEVSLNKDSLAPLYDEELSKKYNRTVYKLSGQKFFALVKCMVPLVKEPYKGNLPAGSSFSLIGSKGLLVANKPGNALTYVFDGTSFNNSQIVSTYPSDAGTYFRPFIHPNLRPSDQVNRLLSPDEIVAAGRLWSEILIYVNGSEETPIDKDIPKLTPIGVLAYDTITDKNLSDSEEGNFPIILVDTKAYEKEINSYNGRLLRVPLYYKDDLFNDSFFDDEEYFGR